MNLYLGNNLINNNHNLIKYLINDINSFLDGTILSYENESLTLISDHAFYMCSSLTTVIFPNCISIDKYAFYSCSNLTTISFPNCISIGAYAFYSCSNLTTTVPFSNCEYIGMYAFSRCLNLSIVSFPKCTYIENHAFRSCYRLISFYLNEVSSVPTLSGTSTFHSTPIGGYSTSAGRYGSVFVPSSLYASFLTADNWSSISARIVSV